EPWGRLIDVRSRTPQVWLDYQAVETADGLLLRCDYLEGLLHPETVATVFRDFANRVRTIAEAPHPRLDGNQAAIYRGARARSIVSASTLDGLVEAQARSNPHRSAIIARGEALSYRALDRAANRIANALRAAGVKAGDRVGIFCA